MKQITLLKKAYSDIFGKELGGQLAKCANKMSKINEAGLNEENMQEYTVLAEQFQSLLDKGGGLDVIKAYNEKIMTENHIKEQQDENYRKPKEKEERAGNARAEREEKAKERFAEYGILPEWYSFSEGPRPVLCRNEREVYYGGTFPVKCEVEEVYDVMLDLLLLYKKQYEFEQKDASCWIKDITVINQEWGTLFHCTKGGSFQFAWTDMCADDKTIEHVKQAGYAADYYDQYMATTRYVKTTDDSVFQELSLTVVVKQPQGNRKTAAAVLRYPIPEMLREDILQYIRTNRKGLEIIDYSLCEKIIAYFTEERLMRDAEATINSIRH